MPRIRPSRKVLACLVAASILMLVICGLTYRNRAARLMALESKVHERQERLDDSERIAKRLTAVEDQYLDAETTLGVLEKGVSTKAYVPTLLRQVEDLGRKVNLRVVGIRPKPAAPVVEAAPSPDGEKKQKPKAKKPEPYDKLDIDLEISGKYWDVVRFLEEITCFPKIITVNDLQIAPVGQPMQTAAPVLAVRLSTTAFILKEVAPAPRVGTEHRASTDLVKAGGGDI